MPDTGRVEWFAYADGTYTAAQPPSGYDPNAADPVAELTRLGYHLAGGGGDLRELVAFDVLAGEGGGWVIVVQAGGQTCGLYCARLPDLLAILEALGTITLASAVRTSPNGPFVAVGTVSGPHRHGPGGKDTA
jgi:hypothetical protein